MSVAADTLKLRAAQAPGTGVRVGSSPDNDGTYQYRQMVRVRQQDRKAYVRNQRLKSSFKIPSGSNLADRGRAATHTRTAMLCVADSLVGLGRRLGRPW